MILLDSSGWIEVFIDGPIAARFEGYLKRIDQLVISTINLFEVYRKIARTSEEDALRAVAAMREARLVPVDEAISLDAADLSLRYKLALADSIVLATARLCHATLVTKDPDFTDLPQCTVIR